MAGGSPPVAVKVSGAHQLRRAFDKMGDRAEDLQAVDRNAAEVILRRADVLVPRASGELAATGRIDSEATGARVVYGGLLPYAGPIHFGWRARNIEPQPWLTDATEQSQAAILREYDKATETIVRRFDVEAPDER